MTIGIDDSTLVRVVALDTSPSFRDIMGEITGTINDVYRPSRCGEYGYMLYADAQPLEGTSVEVCYNATPYEISVSLDETCVEVIDPITDHDDWSSDSVDPVEAKLVDGWVTSTAYVSGATVLYQDWDLADVRIALTVEPKPVGAEEGFIAPVLRWVDDANYLGLVYSFGNLSLREVIAGTPTDTVLTTYPPDQPYNLIVQAVGDVFTIYSGGGLYEATGLTHLSSGRVGFMVGSNAVPDQRLFTGFTVTPM